MEHTLGMQSVYIYLNPNEKWFKKIKLQKTKLCIRIFTP